MRTDEETRPEQRGMVNLTCPWCEATMAVAWQARDTEQSCPHCLTTWAFEPVDEPQMARAA